MAVVVILSHEYQPCLSCTAAVEIPTAAAGVFLSRLYANMQVAEKVCNFLGVYVGQ